MMVVSKYSSYSNIGSSAQPSGWFQPPSSPSPLSPELEALFGSINGGVNRSQFLEQLQNRDVMRAFIGRMNKEVGSQGAEAQIAWAETVFNRAAARYDGNLMPALAGNYYPKGERGIINGDNPAFESIIMNVCLRGTNRSQGSTGNASGKCGFGEKGWKQVTICGEKFGVEMNDVAWHNANFSGDGTRFIGGGGNGSLFSRVNRHSLAAPALFS